MGLVWPTQTHALPRNRFNEYLRPAGIETHPDLHILHGFEAALWTWDDVVAEAVAYCYKVGAKVLIIDTVLFWTRLEGEQENSSGAVQKAARPLQQAVAEHKLTITFAHHDQKGGASDVYAAGRGSSAWQAVTDLILNLTRPQGTHRPTIRELCATGRYARVPGSLMIELNEEGRYVSLGSERAVAAQETRNALMEVLPIGDEAALDMEQVYEQVRKTGIDVANTTTYNELMKLIDKGYVVRSGRGRKGAPHKFSRPLPG